MWFWERLPGEGIDSRYQKHTCNFRCKIRTGKKTLSVPWKELWMDDEQKLPIFAETKLSGEICRDMVPQGLCFIGGYTLISAYCGGQRDGQKHNSIIYVVDSDGRCKWIWELPFRAHVGGLAYDGRYLWVCSGGNTLSAFAVRDCIALAEKYGQQAEGLVVIKEAFRKKVTTDTTTSFCTYHQKYLWSGKFVAPPNYSGEPWIYGYPLLKEKGLEPDIAKQNKISVESVKHVQGLCFAEFEEKKYVLLSKSYGKYLASHVEIYEYSCEEAMILKKQPLISIKLPPMLEQIAVKEGRLYLLFESSAQKFYVQGKAVGNCRFPVNRLCAVYLEKMLNELKARGMPE